MSGILAKVRQDIAWGQQPASAVQDGTGSLTTGMLGGFSAASDIAACLLPLLTALGWRGNPRDVAEALPHFADTLDLTALRNVMVTLNYSSRPFRGVVAELEPRLLPCLFVPDHGAAMVVLTMGPNGLTVFNGETAAILAIGWPQTRGTAYFFTLMEREAKGAAAAPPREGWFGSVIGRFRILGWQIFGITFLLNVLALAVPIFTMAVYDNVVVTGSGITLVQFVIGVVLALGADMLLRGIRARILAHVGARLEIVVGTAIFQRLMYLAPVYTERATIGAQVARIRDFESVREFFTGPLAMVFVEVPFALFYVIVIGLMGGMLAVVPLVALVVFVIAGVIVLPIIRSSVSEASKAGSRRQEFLVETLSKMQALKYCGVEAMWLQRYRELSAKAAMANFHTAEVSSLVATIGHVLTVAAGIATLTLGVFLIFGGTLTVGALISVMMLVWRVLAPLQTGFVSWTRFEAVRSSIRQIDSLMVIRPERDTNSAVQPVKRFRGRVSFSRVSLRYGAEADPALVGVTFQAEPGEVVAVVGPNGSGKSTVVKLIAGLYPPQAGSVRIDNLDIRQIDPIQLRLAVGYVPQTTNLFFGTIAQNLRLANPIATDEELHWAMEQTGALNEVLALPRGFDTRIGDGRSEQLSTSLIQCLGLARAYIKRAPVMLFDEPVNGLDFEGDRTFMRAVEAMRGHATVFIVTHRPSHLKIADRILVFESGYLRMGGPAAEVIANLPPDLF
ncbi:MAG: ATP-binding cassette domain-containing protein [Alphaproteobacteria bacterium]